MMKNQNGNVLFYILIAVTLLAALSYVVAGSLRGGGQGLVKERAKMDASEIIEYGNIIATAVSQIRLRGYQPESISFENSIIDGYENEMCKEDGCRIFSPSGGGVSYTEPKVEWLDAAQSIQSRYGEIYFNASTSVSDIGTGADDLLLVVPYLKKELCIAINSKLGILQTEGEAPEESIGPVDLDKKFSGVFDSSEDLIIAGSGSLEGHSAGCTQSSGNGSPAGTYHYYQVLSAR